MHAGLSVIPLPEFASLSFWETELTTEGQHPHGSDTSLRMSKSNGFFHLEPIAEITLDNDERAGSLEYGGHLQTFWGHGRFGGCQS